MPIVQESIFIPKPPQEVFDYISDPNHLPEWDSAIVESQQIDDGPVKVGTRTKGKSKILGRRFDWSTEVTEFDPPRRVVSRGEGDLKFTVIHITEPEGDGTRFTARVEADSGLGGIFGKVADPLVQKAYSRTSRANLETLVEILTEH